MNDALVSLEHIEAEASKAEHILLSSGDGPDSSATEVTPSVTNRQFSQVNKIKGYTANFAVFDDSYLAVNVRKFRNSRDCRYWISLAFLNPDPVRESRVDRPWLWTSLGLATITAVLILISSVSARPVLEQWWLPGTVLASAAAVIAFLVFLYRSYDKLVFYSQHGRTSLLEILNRNPSGRAVNAFVDDLVERIKKAQGARLEDKARFLCDELREHTRLKKQGVLPVDEFEQVMSRILSHHS